MDGVKQIETKRQKFETERYKEIKRGKEKYKLRDKETKKRHRDIKSVKREI